MRVARIVARRELRPFPPAFFGSLQESSEALEKDPWPGERAQETRQGGERDPESSGSGSLSLLPASIGRPERRTWTAR